MASIGLLDNLYKPLPTNAFGVKTGLTNPLSPFTSAGSSMAGSTTPSITPAIGVKATSPTTNVSQPTKVLPSTQIAKTTTTPAYTASQSTPGQLSGNQSSGGDTIDWSKVVDPSQPNPNATPNTTSTATNQTYSASNPVTYPGLIQQAANVASGPSADYQKQEALANQYNDELTRSRMNEATALGNNATNPIPLEFQQGRAQVMQNQYTQEQAALGAGFQGASTLQGAANTNQGLQQTGLLGAAAAASPQQYGLTNQPYNPLTDSYGGGGTGGVLNRATLAGQVAGAQTAGAAQGTIQAQQATQVAQYQSALNQGKNLQSQLTDLITTFGLNPSNLNLANAGLQKIAANTSDPHYQQLSNYINDVANTYSQVLTPPGGSATDTTRSIAASMLSATASGQSIIDVMKGLDNAAEAKIAGVPTTNQNANTSTNIFSW